MKPIPVPIPYDLAEALESISQAENKNRHQTGPFRSYVDLFVQRIPRYAVKKFRSYGPAIIAGGTPESAIFPPVQKGSPDPGNEGDGHGADGLHRAQEAAIRGGQG